jgi:hypothetical protein
LEPAVELSTQLTSLLRVRPGEIFFLTWIGFKIIELYAVVIVKTDQLILTLSDRPTEAVLLMKGIIWIVEEDRLPLQLSFTGQKGNETLPVLRNSG